MRFWRVPQTKGDFKRLGWLSKQFETESQFQEEIARVVEASGLPFLRESRTTSNQSRTRSDIFIIGSYDTYIEAKIDTKSSAMDRALGQALRNAVSDGLNTWIVVPDDVKIKREHAACAIAIGVEILRFSEVAAKLPTLPFGFRRRQYGFLDVAGARAKAGLPKSIYANTEEVLSELRKPIDRVKALEGV